MDSRASLREIAASIRQRNYGEARIQLQAFLKQNSQNAEAWYMLSFVAKTPKQRVQAAQRAARLSPENERYNQRLKKLTPARRGWLLPLVVVIVVVVVVAGIIMLTSSGGGDSGIESAGLPTLAELPTLTASPQPTSTELPQVSGATAVNPAPLPSATQTKAIPSPTITDTPVNTPGVLVVPSVEVFPTKVPPALVTPTAPIVLPSPANGLPQPTLPQPPTNAATIPSPTIPALSPIPATPTFPVPTLNVVDIVAVGTARDIGGGELRVLEATRPGEALLQELAGSVPTTPANHNWVIFEMLLVCSGGDNCTPAASAFTLHSNTGAVYTPAASLNLEPVFAPDVYLGGQTWGYLGFIVPTSDSGIWLSLDMGTGEPINFGLQ